MKTSFAILCVTASMATAAAQTQLPEPAATRGQPLPPVYSGAQPASPNLPVYVYDQKPLGGRPYLISPEQAQGIIDRFKQEYPRLGNPRLLIYINRELIDENSGLQLSSHKRFVETTRGVAEGNTPGTSASENAVAGAPHSERVASTNIYRVRERKETPLADRQTARDLERLFGRPLRMAGAQLVDQRVASQLLNGRPLDGFTLEAGSEQARREREAVSKIADVVLELLVSSKDVPVVELSGDRTYTAPDIQVTAIRLSDARILGQATAADLIGQGAAAGRAMRSFGIREIAEATALSLMEDILLSSGTDRAEVTP